jgi:dGTPase
MMRSLIEEFVYSYAPVLENEAAGFDVLGRLIDDFAITTNICISCGDEETEKQKKIRSLIPEEYQPKTEVVPQIVNFSEQYRRILKILDFISGMTDSYAINKFKKIHGIEIAQ